MRDMLPNRMFLQFLTVVILVIFAWASWWVLKYSADNLLKGSTIATWTLLVKSAWDFWFGSSSGGKMRTIEDRKNVDNSRSDMDQTR